jgi:hypothetical protein
MKLNQAKSFIDAAEQTKLNYLFFDDLQSIYHNNDRAVVILNESNSTLWNFRKALPSESREGIVAISNDIEDIRRAQVIGSYDQIKEFANAYGLSLNDDQLKILLTIDSTNKEVMPITGDYHNIFHKLSDAEYEALSDKEKAEYDAKIKEENKRYDLPKGVAAQITI